jgi:hypothetical protein
MSRTMETRVGVGYPSITPPRFESVSGPLEIEAMPFFVLAVLVLPSSP